MSQTKRVTGNYTIKATGGTVVDSALEVTGNLTVTGTTTTVSTTNTAIQDRIVVYNSGEIGTGVTGRYAGIEVERGSVNNALLVFDENDDKFKISTDGGSTYTNLLVTSTTGLTEVVDDTTPQLGGDLEVNGKNIISANTNEDIQLVPSGTGSVTIEGTLKLNDQGATPGAKAGSTLLYAGTAAGGGTGVFFVDDTITDELVSKSKAIVYGLIF
jgi:hypothetical protein